MLNLISGILSPEGAHLLGFVPDNEATIGTTIPPFFILTLQHFLDLYNSASIEEKSDIIVSAVENLNSVEHTRDLKFSTLGALEAEGFGRSAHNVSKILNNKNVAAAFLTLKYYALNP